MYVTMSDESDDNLEFFIPTEIVRIRTGERIWFYWNPIVFSKKSIQVLLKEIEKCMNPTTKRPATPDDECKYSVKKEKFKRELELQNFS